MGSANLIGAVLFGVFLLVGGFLILLGVLIWRKLWNGCSVEVEAECIDIGLHTEALGTGPERTYFPNAKRPVYRYVYQGRRYESGPKLSSNRRGYQPELGRCTIRIDAKHPEKVYSPERKFAALILISIGVLWLAVMGLVVILSLAIAEQAAAAAQLGFGGCGISIVRCI